MKRSSRYSRLLLLAATLLLAVVACRKTPVPVGPSADALLFDISATSPADGTRANTIDSNDDLIGTYGDPAQTGLNINAYYDGSTVAYLSNVPLKYFATGSKWVFWNQTAGDWAHYYWPIPNSRDVTNSVDVDAYGTLDFVGYVPYTLPTSANANDYQISYNYTGSPVFTCTLPYTVGTSNDPATSYIDESRNRFNATEQATLNELLVAYSPDRTKTTDNSAISLTDGVVPLNFQHPFALVYFYLKQAKRGTVLNSITLSDLNIKGVYTAGSGWGSYDATTASLTFALNGNTGLTVPDEVNFNAILGGPFVVMPQTLATANNLTVNRKLPDAADPSNQTASLATTWAPGMVYKYYLDLGKDDKHILVDVEIEPWGTQDYKIPIDVK